MAFKTLNQYQEDKQGEFFVLPNDGDTADVIFLYRSPADVLVADGVHYLSTPSYKGYVHCCGNGCPACNYPTQSGRGIKRDSKIFIPLYNITKGKIEFWDRSTFFEQVLQTSVFKSFPDPSVCVFRITRQGVAGSRDTKYQIVPVFKNSSMPYEKILADNHITFPDGYNTVCKEMTVSEMSAALNGSVSSANLPDYGYTPVPRGTAQTSTPAPDYSPLPEITTSVYSQQPSDLPPLSPDLLVNEAIPEYVPNAVPASDSNADSTSGDDLDEVAF